MKIATWNVNSLKVRLPQVLKWLEENPVDVLCLQETKLTDDKFPAAEIAAAGYLVEFSGQKTYNGVAIVATDLSPVRTLAALHAIEARFGRARGEANAPRTLDLDLIAHGRTVLNGALVTPHPRAHERLFVMGPLAELAPAWVHPVLGETAQGLAAAAAIGPHAHTPTRIRIHANTQILLEYYTVR